MKNPSIVIAVTVFSLVVYSMTSKVQAQCVSFQAIEFTNPSFEGPTGSHISPPSWSVCSYTPDTQPGTWGVTESPSDGSSYLGLIYGGIDWREGVSQELQTPLIGNVAYGFTIDLSASLASGGGLNPDSAGVLEVWAANALCTESELLWSSPIIDHVGWETYSVQFNPSQNYSHIYFLNNSEQQMGYMLLDNLSDFEGDSIVLSIDSHTDSTQVDCSFELMGSVDETSIDSIVLVGSFLESPLSVLVSNSAWNATLSYSDGGFDTLTAFAYYTDLLNNAVICSFVDVVVQILTPTASFSAIPSCANAAMSFLDASTAIGSNTITNWSWNFDDGNTSLLQNPVHSYSLPNFYSVSLEVTSSDGCTADSTIEVTVVPTPESDFTFTEVCLGYTTNFHDFSLPFGGPIVSWSWDYGNGAFSIEENPVYTYPDTGAYQVTLAVTDNNGCADTLTQTVEVFLCASILEADDVNFISIYPNPTSELVSVHSNRDAITAVNLFDATGKLVLSSSQDQRISTSVSILLNGLASGFYHLVVALDEGVTVHQRLIVE